MSVQETALEYLHHGLCVLPAITDQKRPAVSSWKQFQDVLPTEHQIRNWFAEGAGVCLLTGQISGNLELLDFDGGGELFDAWTDLVCSQAPDLLHRLVIERSQSGGRHVIYRCEDPVAGNRKLAQRTITCPDNSPITIAGKPHAPRSVAGRFEVTLTLIETRGEGGLFLCAPSPGYAIEQGSLIRLPVLTSTEHALLIEAARALNETLPPFTPQVTSTSSGRPGDDYNDRGDVRAVLRRHGWQQITQGHNEYWRRPEKHQGWSASLKNNVFYVFSSNAAPFEPDRAYAPFGVFAWLDYAGRNIFDYRCRVSACLAGACNTSNQ